MEQSVVLIHFAEVSPVFLFFFVRLNKLADRVCICVRNWNIDRRKIEWRIIRFSVT